jgi:hypothetical protein
MNKEQLQARLEELERENAALRAAHWLLANEEAFISPEDGAIFFVMPEVSRSNQCRYSLNMNDVFALACADAEPLSWSLPQSSRRSPRRRAGLVSSGGPRSIETNSLSVRREWSRCLVRNCL